MDYSRDTLNNFVPSKRSLLVQIYFLALLLLIVFVAVNVVLYAGGYLSNFRLLKTLFRMPYEGTDSWMPMGLAYDWLKAPHNGLLYQDLFFDQHVKFQYPPSSLLIYAFADRIGLPLTPTVFNLVSWICFPLQAALNAAIAVVLLRKVMPNPPLSTQLGFAAVSGWVAFTLFPVLFAIQLGQIQAWLNMGFTLASLLWLVGRPGATGVVIGAICLIKPQLGLFLIWAGLRREWRFIKGFLVVFAPMTVLSIFAFGFDNNIGYLSVISFLSRHGEAFVSNQSVNGMLNRLLGNGESVQWQVNNFPPYNALVYYPTLVSSVVFVALGMFYRLGETRATLATFLMAGIAFTIASPIVWEHHYGLMPIILTALAIDVIFTPASRVKLVRAAVLGVAYIFLAYPLIPLLQTMLPVGSVLYSYMFFAGCAACLLLYSIRNPFSVHIPNVAPSFRPGIVN